MKLIHPVSIHKMVKELLELDTDPNPDVWVQYHSDYNQVLAAAKLAAKATKAGKPIIETWVDDNGFWYLGAVKEVEARLTEQLVEARLLNKRIEEENERFDEEEAIKNATKEVKRLKKELKAKEALAAKAKEKKTK